MSPPRGPKAIQIEQCICLDLNPLYRKGCGTVGWYGVVHWLQKGGEILCLRIECFGEGDKKWLMVGDIRVELRIEPTKGVGLGFVRYHAFCPRCRDSRDILYFPPNASYGKLEPTWNIKVLGCLGCLKLTWAACQDSHKGFYERLKEKYGLAYKSVWEFLNKDKIITMELLEWGYNSVAEFPKKPISRWLQYLNKPVKPKKPKKRKR